MAEPTKKTEEVRERSAPYKIWKNPNCPGDPIRYLGDFYLPDGRPIFSAQDLVELGFGPGEYTVRAPDNRPFARLLPKWHTVLVDG
jgi:hypothetical protein